MKFFNGEMRQRLECELKVAFAVEVATLIVLVENLVARAEFFLVNDAVFNHVFTPEIVAITVYQGMVKIDGETWSARSYDATQTFEPGDRVHVIEVRGATALVWRD